MGGYALAGKIEGTVVSVSGGGDLVTSITADELRQIPAGAAVTVLCDEHQTAGILAPDHGEPDMTLVAVLSESGLLELRLVGESARDFLGIRPATKVVVKW